MVNIMKNEQITVGISIIIGVAFSIIIMMETNAGALTMAFLSSWLLGVMFAYSTRTEINKLKNTYNQEQPPLE